MLHAYAARVVKRRNTDNFEAYDLYALATQLLQNTFSEDSDKKMREYYQKAIEKDPDFGLAYMGSGWYEMRSYWGGWSQDPQESLKRALEYGQKALALDENQAQIHSLLGDVYVSMGQLDRGIAEHAKARELNPNDPDIKSESAAYLAYAGQLDEAKELVAESMRLNPSYPDWYLWNAGITYYTARDYKAAIDAVERMREPPADALLFLAASYAQLGRTTEAEAVVKRVLALDPQATGTKYAAQQPYKNPDDLEHYKDGLRKAGLPDRPQTN
jgi:adenylate cyclase